MKHRLRWDRGRSRPSAECALADDGRLRRAPPKLTYVDHIRLGVKSMHRVHGQVPHARALYQWNKTSVSAVASVFLMPSKSFAILLKRR